MKIDALFTIRSRPNRQKGLMSVVFALLLPSLFVALALAWDTGYLMVLKGRAQHIANATALSGAKSLFIDDEKCEKARRDANRLVPNDAHMDSACKEAFITKVTISYRPILLGVVGIDSDNLIAHARAGIIESTPNDSSGRIALLDKET